MPIRTIAVTIFIFLIACNISFSQDESGTKNYIEVAAYGSTDSRTPFWLQTNQYGIVPKTSPAASLRAGLDKEWSISQNNKWKFGIGGEVVGNLTEESKLLLPQFHATLKYKNWELFAGRKKQFVGLADSTLGTGSYAWSNNAMPMPRIQIGTTKYISIPFTKNFLAFQAFYSDGWMDKDRPVTSQMKLHQKQFYLRMGKPESPVKLYGGFNHNVQWGGKSPYFSDQNNNLPRSFKSYLAVVGGTIGSEGDHFDATNRVGNHLGTLDLALQIENYSTSILIYRQFIYEDGSLYYLQGLQDGLNGIRIRRKNSYGSNFQITEGVIEFLFTKDQGGSSFVITDGQLRGIDNYFNNQQIRDGWGYYDRTIGTPFIPPTSETVWKFPAYADQFTSNNRVSVYHLGLRGTLFQNIKWHTKLSVSNNSGAYLVPFEKNEKQFSGIVGLESRLNILGGTILKGAVAMDRGGLYPNATGFSIALRKEGIF
jgi:hypothetical protein